MIFDGKQMENFSMISESKIVVRVVGANHMGQPFDTIGVILNDKHFKNYRRAISEKHFFLNMGQVDNVTKKRNYLPIFSDFQNARGLCVHKMYDMGGRVLYENENFNAMNEDRKWELKRFYGYQDSQIEDIRGRLSKLIGKPVVVKGERLALLAVGDCKDGAEKVHICCTDGRTTKFLEVDEFQIRFDESADWAITNLSANLPYID